jgi:hypothetical protein
MQRVHEGDECRHFGRSQVLTVSRHITAALYYLADELGVGQLSGNIVENRPAQAPLTTYAMAVDTLLHVEDQRALSFER